MSDNHCQFRPISKVRSSFLSASLLLPPNEEQKLQPFFENGLHNAERSNALKFTPGRSDAHRMSRFTAWQFHTLRPESDYNPDKTPEDYAYQSSPFIKLNCYYSCIPTEPFYFSFDIPPFCTFLFKTQ